MEFCSDSGKKAVEQKAEKALNSPLSPQAKQRKKLGSILNLQKQTYDDFHPQVLQNMDNHLPKFKGFHQKQIERNRNKSDELVKYMSNLPRYLERGENPQDKAFNVGVLDWRLLEKWQHNNYNDINQTNGKNSYLNNSSSCVSPDEGSSSRYSRGHSWSPQRQKIHHLSLNVHEYAPPTEGCSSGTNPFAGNGEKFQDCLNVSETDCITSSGLKGKGRTRLGEIFSAQEKLEVPSYPLPNEWFKAEELSQTKQMMSFPASVSVSPSRRKNLEEKSFSLKTRNLAEHELPQLKMGIKESTKVRNGSPNGRFRFGLGKSSSSASSGNSTCQKSNSIMRGRSSPLRRLLDPLFKPKGDEPNQLEEVKLDSSGKLDDKDRLSTVQALLQVAVKNGLPLFTFTVDNYSDILAATLKESSFPKKAVNGWVYRFFNFSEMQKKNVHWINKGSKDRHHTFITNVVAQMRVSAVKSCAREFVLTSMSTRHVEKTPDSVLNDELAAIILKFPENFDSRENVVNGYGTGDILNMKVILPGGNHGVPRKGDPPSLIERWTSGGSCDCGGWDLGCRIRVLTNSSESCQKLGTIKSHLTAFKLFPQHVVEENKPLFTLSPFEDGIFSVEFNSSLQLIQAFSIGIAILNGRNMVGGKISEEITSSMFNTNKGTIPNRAAVDVSAAYVSYPPLSPFGRV